jgi:hypothetical protein
VLTSRVRRTIQPFIRQGERLPLLLHPNRDRTVLFSPSTSFICTGSQTALYRCILSPG